MKITFLVRGQNHPATRYRVIQYRDYLHAHNIETDIVTFPNSFLAWRKLTKQLKNSDIVFIQKKRVADFWLSRIKRNGTKIIYDLDDAVMFASSRHKSPDSPSRMKQFVKMVKMSDLVICGNNYLKSVTQPHNHRVYVIPTTIDLTKYPIKDYPPIETPGKARVTLGWIGGGKSLVFLKKLLPLLEKLAGHNPDIQLKIVCNEFFDSATLPIIKKAWSEADEIKDILSFDIGLAPLPDDPWSRGKCAAKLLQYMAAGVPGIASPVGMHNEIIRDNTNGFLAANHDEWYGKILTLIQKPDLRKQLGLAARKTVEQDYSVKANAPKLLSIFKKVTNK